MMRILMIRHAATSWNLEGRMQGWRDVPLCETGRDTARHWSLPRDIRSPLVLCSPLSRARETASLMGLKVDREEPRLIEMHWGELEGRRLDEVRAADPAFVAEERKGLDFRPAGGESPREVTCRLGSLLDKLRASGSSGGSARTVVMVTHKGVMRAALALATGWSMRDKPPVRLVDGSAVEMRVVEMRVVEGEGLQLVGSRSLHSHAPEAACAS